MVQRQGVTMPGRIIDRRAILRVIVEVREMIPEAGPIAVTTTRVVIEAAATTIGDYVVVMDSQSERAIGVAISA